MSLWRSLTTILKEVTGQHKKMGFIENRAAEVACSGEVRVSAKVKAHQEGTGQVEDSRAYTRGGAQDPTGLASPRRRTPAQCLCGSSQSR